MIDVNELNKVIEKVNNWCQCNCNHMYNIFHNCITVEQKLAMLQWAVKKLAENQYDLSTGFIELKEYVDNYFKNLDITEELKNIINEMIDEGTFQELFDGNILTSYVNVVSKGAKNDGKTDTGAIINSILRQYSNATFYFPAGVYMIETPIIIDAGNRVAFHLDGAVLKASGAISCVINVTNTGTTDEKFPPLIWGNGVIDMNSLASIGILVQNNSRYLKLKDFNIEGIGNGIGIQLGTDNGASMSTVLQDINVRGTSSSNLSSIGVLVIGYDCYFTNVNIIRCYGGIRLLSGGNMINNCHVWSDLDVQNSNWLSSYGIYNGFIDNMINNVYLDNVGVGIWALQPTLCSNIYYYLPIAGNGSNTASIFRTAQNNIVKAKNVYCVKKNGFTINPINIANRSQVYFVGSTKAFMFDSNIYDTEGFEVVSEAFNIRNNKFTNLLAKNNEPIVTEITTLFMGYLSKTTGTGVLSITYGSAFSYDILIDSERTIDLSSSGIKTTLISGQQSSIDKIIIGKAVTVNGLIVYPVYFKVPNGFSSYLTVDFNSNSELNFYLASHLNARQCAYTGSIDTLLEIDI